jgi:hypothetical protein
MGIWGAAGEESAYYSELASRLAEADKTLKLWSEGTRVSVVSIDPSTRHPPSFIKWRPPMLKRRELGRPFAAFFMWWRIEGS